VLLPLGLYFLKGTMLTDLNKYQGKNWLGLCTVLRTLVLVCIHSCTPRNISCAKEAVTQKEKGAWGTHVFGFPDLVYLALQA